MKTVIPRHFLYPIIISVIVLILAALNYVPGTWLLGWDSLSDEFNFGINFKRQFFGVWNEYQGLGSAGGHAHESDITRFIFLWLASFILPVSIVRYTYFFFTLLVGALGMYQFSKYIFKRNHLRNYLALIATSFYVFNLGTLQIFYVPFEMFNAQFMVLPWIFLYVIKFVRHAKLKNYLLLCLFIILGTPQGYAPVLFYAQVAAVAGFLLIYLLLNSNKLQIFLRSLYIGVAFIILNLYWMLPNLYFIKNYSASVSASKINSLFSEEAFLYSSKWGTWLDFPILRGFLFGWLDYKYASQENDYLMEFWRGYMANPLAIGLGLLFFAIILVGITASVIKRKTIFIPLIPIFCVCLFMIIGANGILQPIWFFLRDHSELFREGLRFPYSKFSIILQFIYSIFFVYGIIFILGRFKDKIKFNQKYLLLACAIVPLLYMWPFFTGNLIAKEMQIELPNEYQALFDKFENENPNKRIVYLPANNLFGWQYYDWGGYGYQGAGFVWFGLAQSFVTRDFDRWHPANEQLYSELQYAIYNEDPKLLEYLLKKYDVSYIILDKNIIAPNNPKSLFFKQTGSLLKLTKDLKLTDTLGNLEVYKFENPSLSESYVEFPANVQASRQIDFEKGHYYFDTNYADNVLNYSENNLFEATDLNKVPQTGEIEIKLPNELENLDKTFAVSVPFASRRDAIPVEFVLEGSELQMNYIYPEIQNKNGNVIFSNVPEDLFPSISTGSNQVLINNQLLRTVDARYKALIDEDSELVEFGQTNTGVFEYSNNVYSATAADCSGVQGDVAKIIDPEFPGSVRMETKEGVTGCLNFVDRISNAQPVMYKISFEYKNSDSAIPMYCLSDASSGECFNAQYKNRPQSSTDAYSIYEDYVLVDRPEIVRFVLVLASADLNTPASGNFKNIKIERFEVSSIRKLLNPALRGLEKNLSVKSSDFPLKVKFPDYSNLSSAYVPGSKWFSAAARSCSQFSEKSYKRDLVTQDGINAYLYSSEDAISCDSLEAVSINTDASYLVSFDTERLGRQGLDVCLWGIDTEKCLLQERLDGGVETYLLPSYSSAGGVSISMNNSSIGRIPTTNKLYSVKVDYVPYAWLKEIVIWDKSVEMAANIENAAISKKSLYRYDIRLENSQNGQSTVNIGLNQSFDEGWVLLDKNSCFMGIVSPGLCKKPDSMRFLYNGWANGWQTSANGSDYVIIFWPQLLQIGGYAVFALFIGVLALAYGVAYSYRSLNKRT